MKLSVQNGGLVELFGHDRTFSIIRKAGFDAMDYNLDHVLKPADIKSGMRSSVVDAGEEAILEYVRPVKEASERYGVEIGQIHTPFPTYVPDRSMVDHVRRATELSFIAARYLGCRHCVVHPGFGIGGLDQQLSSDDEWKVNIDFYRSLIDCARDNDVVICLENLFVTDRGKVYQGPCANPDEALRYVDTLNGMAGERRFGLCFDVGHANLVGLDMYRTIMKLKDIICVLHVHDNNGLQDQHLFPYMGIVNWNRFLEGLADSGYDGNLSFETFNAIRKIDPALAQSAMDYLGGIGRFFLGKITDRHKERTV